MTTKTSKAYSVKIYVSGPIEHVKQACRRYCLDVGLCVTVEPTTFIYTGGEEQGAVVGLIQYPRFETTEEIIWERAQALASFILDNIFQHSVLITDGIKTEWTSRRQEK